jgi:glycosyltransferase involved in cell wall biosynthesis
MKAVADCGVGKEFHALGVVGYREVQSLMFHAHAVLNPSLFEGWSTTVEEAKALGKRLLLSDIPVHREQAEGIAHFFDKTSPSALASVLEVCSSEPRVSVDDAIYHKANVALQEYAKTYQDIVIKLVQSGGQR